MRIAYEALTFDDVLLIPGHSRVLPREAKLTTKLSRNISINVPLVSAAMDSVTETRLAISMAQEGGIGIMHKNMPAEAQALKVRKVKRFESGIVRDPVTTTPNTTIREFFKLTEENKISGVPVVVDDKLVGIVTSRDVRYASDLDVPVSTVMTPQEKLVTVKKGEEKDKQRVLALFHEKRVEKVLVVSGDMKLEGLITAKDFRKSESFPNACKDKEQRLRVGAAVGIGEANHLRVQLLVEAGVDVVVVDTAHGHSQGVIDMVAWVKSNYPSIDVIGGNIATAQAAIDLADAGADGVKVGIGPGSICTTRMVAGVGVPQLTAISDVAEALKGRDVPIIADGGIRYSGDISKALAAGAHSIMAGNMFAGTDEAPGDVEIYNGRSFKNYRGMGSLGAMQQGSSDRYFQEGTGDPDKLVPEGIEGLVPYKGPLVPIIHQLVGGVRASMGYTGCATMEEFRTKPQFVKISSAGVKESHVHDVSITKEAPNYPSYS